MEDVEEIRINFDSEEPIYLEDEVNSNNNDENEEENKEDDSDNSNSDESNHNIAKQT